MGTYENGRAFAEYKDSLDPIAHLRDHFYTKENQIYMDGNSLGLCSKDAEQAVLRALEDWKTYGINIWSGAPTNYFLYHDVIGAKLARLINARPEEVTICANTTLNVH
ncbi:MAG: kynureninase, partial [Oscillospiraceae bacterium]|nr:kynureninase [Oscillospiraceae bacterium]